MQRQVSDAFVLAIEWRYILLRQLLLLMNCEWTISTADCLKIHFHYFSTANFFLGCLCNLWGIVHRREDTYWFAGASPQYEGLWSHQLSSGGREIHSGVNGGLFGTSRHAASPAPLSLPRASSVCSDLAESIHSLSIGAPSTESSTVNSSKSTPHSSFDVLIDFIFRERMCSLHEFLVEIIF